MQFKYQNAVIGALTAPSKYTQATATQIPSGGYFATNADGSILSVQRDGSVSTRPAGTTPGSFETFTFDPSVNAIRFAVQDDDGLIVRFGILITGV